MTRDPMFIGAWIALVLLGTPLSFSRNAAFKRRYCHPYLILVGLVFLGFLVADWGVVWGALVGLPIVASLTYFNARNVSFCDCGATTWGQVFRLDRERCRKCGALLPESQMNGKGRHASPPVQAICGTGAEEAAAAGLNRIGRRRE